MNKLNRAAKKEVRESKKFWKDYKLDKEGNFITEPRYLEGYHQRMLKVLRAAGML